MSNKLELRKLAVFCSKAVTGDVTKAMGRLKNKTH